MTIGGKEYKERDTELTADEALRCGMTDENYTKTLQRYNDIEGSFLKGFVQVLLDRNLIAEDQYEKIEDSGLIDDVTDKQQAKLWERYKSLWLKRISFFFEGDVSGLAIDKISQDERQAVEDFFGKKFMPYMEKWMLSQKTLRDLAKAAALNLMQNISSNTSATS